MRWRMDAGLTSPARTAARGLRPPAGGASTRRLPAAFAAGVVVALAWLPACASGGAKEAPDAQAAKTGRPIEIDYLAYGSKKRFGLVNTSHTDRTELYSEVRPLDAATTKVSTDEVLEEVVRYLREQGFYELAQAGAAPEVAPPGVKQALDVTTPEGRFTALLREGAAPEDVRRFLTCVKGFLDVYSNTMQLQAVDRPPDWDTKRPAGVPRKGG